MIRTLLFGAGAGARLYIENEQRERDFIAFMDNDERKFGSDFAGIPVMAPSDAIALEFDEIVITTQWVQDVRKQLIEELGIAPDKVIIPFKQQLKKLEPFRHEPTHELARQLVLGIGALALHDNIPLTIDFGTLLGIVRDGDIIPWDDDVDFAVPAEAAEQLKNWLPTALEQLDIPPGWYIEVLRDKTGNAISVLLKWHTEQSGLRPFITSFSARDNRDGTSFHMSSLGMWYAPAQHFENIETFRWNNTDIPVPADYESYLQFVYGEWRVPKKDMKVTDYNNIGQSCFDDFRDAQFQLSQTINQATLTNTTSRDK